MAWIRIIEEDEATGLLKEIYKRSKKRGSETSEIVKVFSLRPELMDVRLHFGQKMTFGGSGLGRFREELIAVSISAACQCRYWGIAHAEFLREDGGASLDFAKQISTDWREAPLDPADYQMLEFSEKLTLIPSSITEVDIETLRGHGFSDRDILSIILAGAYRSYIVRVADALGIELNPTVDYAPELIQAFGLNEGQARETLYADRQERKAMEDAEQTPPPPSDARPLSDGQSSSSNCWIETDPPGEVAEDFIRARDKLVQLSETSPMHNLAQAFGMRPAALDVTADYMSLLGFGGSGLDMGLEGLIGLSVAHTLSCHYMAVHHAQTLLADGMATEKIHGLVDQAMISAPEKALSDPREHEAVRFCVQLSQSPWTMARSDLDPLRNVGFTDKEIVTIVAGASLENFLCRVADAVGLQLEAQLEGPTVHDLL